MSNAQVSRNAIVAKILNVILLDLLEESSDNKAIRCANSTLYSSYKAYTPLLKLLPPKSRVPSRLFLFLSKLFTEKSKTHTCNLICQKFAVELAAIKKVK